MLTTHRAQHVLPLPSCATACSICCSLRRPLPRRPPSPRLSVEHREHCVYICHLKASPRLSTRRVSTHRPFARIAMSRPGGGGGVPDLDSFANQPVVIDNGSGLMKAGIAGTDMPSLIFPALYVESTAKHVRSTGATSERCSRVCCLTPLVRNCFVSAALSCSQCRASKACQGDGDGCWRG